MNSTLLLNAAKKVLGAASPTLLKKILILTTFLLGAWQNSFAQVNTYAYSEFNGVSNGEVYTPITGGTDLFLAIPDEQVTAATPIGFTFNFNGFNYTTAKISANGFIGFGGTVAIVGTNYTPVSNAATNQYAAAIAGHANNLVFSSFGTTPIYSAVTYPSSVEYKLEGAPGSQVFIVQYKNMARKNGAATAAPRPGLVNFQIKIYEGTNAIEVIQDQQPIAATGVNANVVGQCGLRGAAATDFSTRLATGVLNYTVTTPGGAATSGLNYRDTSKSGTVIRMRWTPPCFPPSGLGVASVTNNSATISWVAPTVPPGNGYQYEIRTSGVGGSGPVGLVTTNTLAGVSTIVSGLPEGTTMTLYVRSHCGGSEYSTWVTGPTFTTSCSATTVPYTLYFDSFTDGFTVPGLPICTVNNNLGTGNNWVTSINTPESEGDGYYDEHLVYKAHPSNAANTWFITKGIQLTAGTTYRLSYLYGGSSYLAALTNRLEVRYGTIGTGAGLATATLLEDHTTIKTSPIENVINFTATATGVHYFGFKAYSAANNANLYLDDIQLFESTCLVPTGLIAPAVLVSFNNATITWTAPSPSPANGYAYYYNTTGVAPTNGTIASGIVPAGTTLTVIPGLLPATTYYVWVRSFCGPGEFGEWSTGTNFTTTAAPPVYCLPSGAGFSQDPNGITNVTFGSINNTTGIELPNYYGDYSGLTANLAQGAVVPISITYATGFTYDTNIWVDWNNNGSFADPGELVYTGVSTNAVPTTLNASFTIPLAQPLGPRRLRIGGIDFGPFSDPCRTGTWQSFEDYTINVIVAPPALTLSASTMPAQCGLTNSPLITITSNIADFDVYTWTPSSGVSGTPATGYTFNTSDTTTYILNASQTSGAFSTNTATFTYVANATPTPITISTPGGTNSCVSGPPIALNAGGGIISNVTLFSENFNSGIDGPPDLVAIPPVLQFKSRNTSTGGAVASAAWTVRPNGYNSGPPTWNSTFNSNDNTSFVLTNSDAQGSGTLTRTRLISPPIDLTGSTSAALSFYHHFRYFNTNDLVYVQVAIETANLVTFPEGTDPESPSLTWVNLIQYTSSQGTPTNFVQAFLNLNPYVGNVIRVRFNYQANWGYGWAIDNFRVVGSASSAIVWSPTTGLYNDASGLSTYTGTPSSIVYASPSTDTVYTATATGPGPTFCESSQTISIAVTPQVGGTLSANQVSCDTSTYTNITLSGHVGTIIRWEYADDAAFTVGVTPIANTTTILTPAEFGTFDGIRYFRAVVGTGICNPVFSAIASVSLPTTTWNGVAWNNGTPNSNLKAVFNGFYDSNLHLVGAVLEACSIVIKQGANVIVRGGDTFSVQNEVVIENNPIVLPTSLQFEDSSSLLQVNDVVNEGFINYFRRTTPVTSYDYTYWSSPVANQVLSAFSPQTSPARFYVFNNTTIPLAYAWQNVSVASAMIAAKGYIIRAPFTHSQTVPSIFEGPFFGVPHNGSYSININVNGANNRNLLGNPYPSAIDADMLWSDNAAQLTGNFYFWTHNTPITANNYNANDYASYNASGGTGTAAAGPNSNIPDGKIAAGQGFFVEGLSSGTVTFNNSIRLAGNNSMFFRSSTQSLEKHRVWLNVINNQGAFKQTLVGYIEGATNERDSRFDGEFVEAGNAVGLYSVLNQDKLTIQGRALPFADTDEIPLGFKTTTAGIFEIQLANFDGLFEQGQAIYLEDKLLNVIHDLRESNYIFTTAVGTFEERFELQFLNGTLGVPTFNEEGVVVYKNNQTIFINTGVTLMKEVKIFDIRGRLVTEKTSINATDVQFSNLNTAQQVLLVQITTEEGVVVTKKVIY